MMLQVSLSIGSHAPSRRRSLDITDLKSHVVNVFNGIEGLIASDAHVKGSPPDAVPDAEFLFGGYSWVKKRFELWAIRRSEGNYLAETALWAYYSPGGKRVEIRGMRNPRREHLLGQVAFAGDQAEVAFKLVRERLTSDYLSGKSADKIDMQPFEVVRDMLRDPSRSHTIGGAPQLVKVYQFMQAVPFAVYWPDKKSGARFLQGRPCADYEQLDTKIIDPDKPAWRRSETQSEVPATSASPCGGDEAVRIAAPRRNPDGLGQKRPNPRNS
jgi:hypothetical protein